MTLSPAEQLAHSTVRIECDLPGGKTGTGTGFFYRLAEKDGKYVPAVITNKHVVVGATKGRFLLTRKDAANLPTIGQTQKFELDNFEGRWVPHPDPTVDLCAMPIAPLLNEAATSNSFFFYCELGPDLIPTQQEIDDLLGVEEIVMVGYPNGLWDSTNNLPLFRRGVLATQYKHDWRGKKEFLIDAACFPGSSGSPVLLFDLGSYQNKKGNFFGSSRIKLLGVLYAGPQYTAQGTIQIVNVPTVQTPVSLTSIPNNLGIIIKAEQLKPLEALFAIP